MKLFLNYYVVKESFIIFKHSFKKYDKVRFQTFRDSSRYTTIKKIPKFICSMCNNLQNSNSASEKE